MHMSPEKRGARRETIPPAMDAVAGPNFVWTAERILFEDEWLIVVDKPAGMPTEPTVDKKRPSVSGTLTGFLRRRDSAEPYLGLHHRLDRDTSGVLLFSKKREANASLTDLFKGRRIQKTYLALAAEGSGCPDAWVVENHLGVVGKAGRTARHGAVRSGGDPARTSFVVLERLRGALLVEARPHTGRTHQIRVHLAEGGHPICGDELYGGPARLRAAAFPRVMLHAARLEFPHPMTGAALGVGSPLPPDLTACLSELR